MDTRTIIELIGYAGSALVLISFLMPSVVKLRLINSAGAIVSAAYALIIASYPVALMNICLLVINGYHLIRLKKSDKQYVLVEGIPGDSMMEYFIHCYGEDIKKYFPGFCGKCDQSDYVCFTCCDGMPVGLLAGKKYGDSLEIDIDYTTKAYRDCSVGKYLYSQLPKKEIRTLTINNPTDQHKPYLEKMGFKEEKGIWRKAV